LLRRGRPDNILVTASYDKCVLCDFGSAFASDDPDAAEVTPYLVSRFYRAPEIALGLRYGPPIDVWSAACTVAEMYTGDVLFSGHGGTSNNDLLRSHMETKGRFPNRMIKRHVHQYTPVDRVYSFA